jgi:hypothetical protein
VILLPALGAPEILGQVAGLLLGTAASLAVALVPLRLVSGRVPRLAEE